MTGRRDVRCDLIVASGPRDSAGQGRPRRRVERGLALTGAGLRPSSTIEVATDGSVGFRTALGAVAGSVDHQDVGVVE